MQIRKNLYTSQANHKESSLKVNKSSRWTILMDQMEYEKKQNYLIMVENVRLDNAPTD